MNVVVDGTMRVDVVTSVNVIVDDTMRVDIVT